MPEGIEESGTVATINFLDAVTLTDDYDDNTSDAFAVSPFTQLEFIFDYTEDSGESGNSALVKLLFSENGTEYHDYSVGSDQTPSGGEVKTILYPRIFQIQGDPGNKVTRWCGVPTSAKYVKVAVMEDGLSSDGGILTVKARVSNDLTWR